MELWIRSQDKEDLIKVDNLGLAYQGKYNFMDKIGDVDNYCICQFVDDYHVKLGTYKTKERALEILEEIQNLFTKLEPVKTILNKDGLQLYLVQMNSIVFNMPEE